MRGSAVALHTTGFSPTAVALAAAVSGDAYEPSRSVLVEREMLILFLAEQYVGAAGSVASYLRRNSDIAWMLIGAKPAISAEFGDVEVTLRLIQDSDSDEPSDKIFAYVRTGLPLDDALDALDRFDATWLLPRLQSVAGRLNIDLAF